MQRQRKRDPGNLSMDGLDPDRLPRHVAIIMDGNGRWAKNRAKSRIFGHGEGANSVREIVRCSRRLGIEYLTLYAFSKENWQRPQREITALWRLLKRFLRSEAPELIQNEIRLVHLGDVEGIPRYVLDELRAIETSTAGFDRMFLNLALNYGGRQEIVRAAKSMVSDALSGALDPDKIDLESFANRLQTHPSPEPDLIIRTGGECRMSNFLLWQMAYAELYFTDVLWPDFHESHFIEALACYGKRERRFGKTGEQVQPAIRPELGVVNR